MRYWLDADVFIQTKNNWYPFDQVPGFWRFLSKQIDQGLVCVPKIVFAELTDGKDELSEWCKTRKKKLCVAPAKIINDNYREVLAHVVSKHPKWDHHAPFMKGGDGWLVAHGMAGDTVVAHEARYATKTVVKVPTICDDFNVECISIFEMNKRLGFRIS